MLFANLLLIAAEEEAPLIDVDGTVFVQFAFFLLMLAILRQLLFKPYLALRDARYAGMEGARDEAKHMNASAEKALLDYQARLADAKARGNEERAKLRTDLAANEREILGLARAEAQKATEQAKQTISVQRDKAEKALTAEAEALSKQMIRKVLGREVA